MISSGVSFRRLKRRGPSWRGKGIGRVMGMSARSAVAGRSLVVGGVR